MNITLNCLENITKGTPLTMVLVNTMGMPIVRHIKYDSHDIVDAKRYQSDFGRGDCLQLFYIEKGKRKVVGCRFNETELTLAIGHQEVAGAINSKDTYDVLFNSFDDAKMSEMANQLKNIIFSQRN